MVNFGLRIEGGFGQTSISGKRQQRCKRILVTNWIKIPGLFNIDQIDHKISHLRTMAIMSDCFDFFFLFFDFVGLARLIHLSSVKINERGVFFPRITIFI